MFNVKQTANFAAIGAAVSEYLEQEAFEDAARVIIPAVKERTHGGKSYNGQQFPPYSKTYAKRRQRRNLQTGHVDLSVTNEMQDSLHLAPDFIAPGTRIVEPDAASEPRARGHEYGNPDKNLPARPWLGVDDATAQQATNAVAAGIRGVVEALNK